MAYYLCESDLADPEIVELACGETQGSTIQRLDLNVELLFGSMHLEDRKLAFSVSLRKARLKLRTGHGAVVRQTKFASEQKPSFDSAEVTANASVSSEILGAIDVKPSSIGASLSGKRRRNSNKTAARSEILPRVLAQAGNVWLISEPNGEPLSGRYLGDENLCSINDIGDSAVEIEVLSNYHDVVIRDVVRVSDGKPVAAKNETAAKLVGIAIKKAMPCIAGQSVWAKATIKKVPD